MSEIDIQTILRILAGILKLVMELYEVLHNRICRKEVSEDGSEPEIQLHDSREG